ncbi:hypothetical protein [Plectonema radiosum]|uniref:hypothetical protein n=1 Tax=Plectonema radiosum TaxID=945768 RepID=UPI001D143FCD|nr:hypothetical protein [Plectonema radiosum]
MKNNAIAASLSTQSLIFRPNEPPVSFEVTVNNDSDRFANFQLEIAAAGEKRNSDGRWYRLEPEIAAAQPDGSSTKFQVFILDTPIPGFVGTINLTVKVFSPQLGQERRLLLRLQIERDQKPNLINLELSTKQFQVYPGNTVDILARLQNMGQQPANITLRFAGIDPSWLMGNAERRLSINPGKYTEVIFPCQPPSVGQAPSQDYPFNIEATSHNSYPASATGNLEVLPVGFIKFSTEQHQQTLSQKGRWLPDWKSKTVVYELLFKNTSNLRQEIGLQIQGRDWRKCTFRKYPETANLDLGQTNKIDLEVGTKRPWVGMGKTLLLEARAELSDQRLGSTDPATQTLELEVLPIIPLWLQLAIIALIAILLALLLRQSPIQHLASVNSVRVNGIASSVVSGSDDCTLRFWRIGTNTLKPEPTVVFKGKSLKTCGQQHKPQGLLADVKDPIAVLQFIPDENNRVAVGLDKGVIELIEVPTGEVRSELQDTQGSGARGDRIFDLAFTSNSLNLFAGHGSGKLRVWSRNSVDESFQTQPKVFDFKKQQKLTDFQIRALALSPDDTFLVVAGQFKRFLILPVNQVLSNNSLKIPVQTIEKPGFSTGKNDYIWGLAFAADVSDSKNTPFPAEDYRLKNRRDALSAEERGKKRSEILQRDRSRILATSDSSGLITIWDLNQCRATNSTQQDISNLNCTQLAQWQDKSKNSIRSLAFSDDSSYLVSGGDDGRVVVWYLNPDYTLDKTKWAEGKTIDQRKKAINSIDVRSKQGFVISGGQDAQVKLHPIK